VARSAPCAGVPEPCLTTTTPSACRATPPRKTSRKPSARPLGRPIPTSAARRRGWPSSTPPGRCCWTRYDKGETDQDSQPSADSIAVELLRQLFEAALDDDRNIVEAAREALSRGQAELPSEALVLRQRLSKLQRRRELIKASDGVDNIAHLILANKMNAINRELSAITLKLAVVTRASEMLGAYSDEQARTTVTEESIRDTILRQMQRQPRGFGFNPSSFT
jgi:hypothetical protein